MFFQIVFSNEIYAKIALPTKINKVDNYEFRILHEIFIAR